VTNPAFTRFPGTTPCFTAAGRPGAHRGRNSGSLELNHRRGPNVTAARAENQHQIPPKSGCWTPAGHRDDQAQAIIGYRTKNGFFRNIDELTKVKGISASVLAKIRPFITVAE